MNLVIWDAAILNAYEINKFYERWIRSTYMDEELEEQSFDRVLNVYLQFVFNKKKLVIHYLQRCTKAQMNWVPLSYSTVQYIR